ncbi:MAG: gamma-glutamyltransferase family protein [Bacillota bacterium]|nr:gamma-glutamyltransferase family protein [Bacillota bacterium]
MMYDPNVYAYPSRRMVVYGQNGMVATSHHLAAQIGLDIMKEGGNAIDAAVATAAALTVLEPISNGIGGDAFAIVWTNDKLYGLNSSGPFPGGISAQAVRAAGHTQMPLYGWLPVTVPGAPAAWRALIERFGRLSLADVLRPATAYARNGFPVPPCISEAWQSFYQQARNSLTDQIYESWFATFSSNGRAPHPGEIWQTPDHADTLQRIAETNAEAFYCGEIAEKIDRFSRQSGGYLRFADLAAYHPEWVDPVSVHYHGFDVWELPPNGQGLVALMALGMLNNDTFTERDVLDEVHRQIESIKMAFSVGKQHITDPKDMFVSVNELLSDQHLAECRNQMTEAASNHPGIIPKGSNTVYLATADGHGNMVSFIQSNYKNFGSYLVVPGTGIALQNRGADASLDEQHVNIVKGGKRPYHTIIPGFLSKDGAPVGPFGVMGATMQPQGHLQILMNTIDFHLNPQAALDAPRWRWIGGNTVAVEKGLPDHLIHGLQQKGHVIEVQEKSSFFGRGQIIWRSPFNTLIGGTEPRADGAVVSF